MTSPHASIAPHVQAFFTEHLCHQKRVSPHTIASCRDTFRLLLTFRGLSSNGAENWDRASSLLDRPLRPPNDHGVFPRIIFCNHLFLRTFMHQQPKTTREVLPYVIPLRRCESTDV